MLFVLLLLSPAYKYPSGPEDTAVSETLAPVTTTTENTPAVVIFSKLPLPGPAVVTQRLPSGPAHIELALVVNCELLAE